MDWYISVAFYFSQAAIYFIVDTLILNTLCLYLLNSFKHTKGFINFCFILGEFVGGFIISIYVYGLFCLQYGVVYERFIDYEKYILQEKKHANTYHR